MVKRHRRLLLAYQRAAYATFISVAAFRCPARCRRPPPAKQEMLPSPRHYVYYYGA